MYMAALRTFANLVVVAVVLGVATTGRADIVLFENFDDDIDTVADPTDAAFVKSDVSTEVTSFFVVTSGTDDYWGIHDPDPVTGGDTYSDFDTPGVGGTVPDSGAIPTYTFPVGSGNYLVGENLVDHPDTNFDDVPFSLTWNNLNVTGLTDLSFSGFFAAVANEFDAGDYIRVLYRFDSDSTDPSTFFQSAVVQSRRRY